MNREQEKWVNVSVGLFILLGISAFLFLILKVSAVDTWMSGNTYEIMADFTNIGNLKTHAPVRISGVKIGEVSQVQLAPDLNSARVSLLLNRDIQIPYEDVSARILTEGLLGSNYISIVPGFDDSENKDHLYLKAGDWIHKTQEAMILENLIGQLLFNIKQ